MRPIMTAAELDRHKVDIHGRDYSRSDDGYSDMEVAATEGWRPLAGWGADGWDLGDWPYVVISLRNVQTSNLRRWPTIQTVYEMRQTCEGDVTGYAFDSAEDRLAAIDYLFLWYALGHQAETLADGDSDWAQVYGDGNGRREGLDAGTLRVPERLRGPYRASRAEASS